MAQDGKCLMRGPVLPALLLIACYAGGGPLLAQDSLGVGAAAPSIEIPDLDGKPVDLGQYIGKKPVFLEFWATWCELCEELLPEVRAAQEAYGSEVAFFGINISVNQTPERVRRYIETHKPPFRTLYDKEGVGIRAYRVPVTSYVVIVDKSGRVAYTGSGGTQDFDSVLRRVTRH
jgi:thiol-disulfide isomerase/thioredoxin